MRGRTLAFGMLVAFQAAVLVGGAVAEETRVAGGEEVVLQAAPVDPRDLLRGDYVVLAYEISTYRTAGFDPGDVVYVELVERGGVWEPVAVTAGHPGGTAIRGRVARPGWIEYGIEGYFVPEGRGGEIETADDVKVVASLGDDGRARIRHLLVDGRRWE